MSETTERDYREVQGERAKGSRAAWFGVGVSGDRGWRRVTAEVALSVAIGALVFALFWLRLSHHLTEDSTSYAAEILQSDKSLVHPHHLLYGPLLHFLEEATTDGQSRETSVVVLQAWNVFFSACAVALVWQILIRLGLSYGAASLMALGFGFASGFYDYSSQIEIYNLTTLCLAFAVLGLVWRGRRWVGDVITVAGWTASMLLHQTALFFGIAIVANEILRHEPGSFRRIVLQIVPAGVVVVLAYLWAGFVAAGCSSLREFWMWMTAYAHLGLWGKGSLSLGTLKEAIKGAASAIVSPDFGGIGYALAGLVAFLAFGIAALYRVSLRRFLKTPPAIALVAWTVVVAIFNFWWCPWNREFWIASLLAGIVLVGILWKLMSDDHSSSAFRISLAFLLVCSVLVVVGVPASIIENNRLNEERASVLTFKSLGGDKGLLLEVGTVLGSNGRLYLGLNQKQVVTACDLIPEAGKSKDVRQFLPMIEKAIVDTVDSVLQQGNRAFAEALLLDGYSGELPRYGHWNPGHLNEALRQKFEVDPVSVEGKTLLYEFRPIGKAVTSR